LALESQICLTAAPSSLLITRRSRVRIPPPLSRPTGGRDPVRGPAGTPTETSRAAPPKGGLRRWGHADSSCQLGTNSRLASLVDPPGVSDASARSAMSTRRARRIYKLRDGSVRCSERREHAGSVADPTVCASASDCGSWLRSSFASRMRVAAVAGRALRCLFPEEGWRPVPLRQKRLPIYVDSASLSYRDSSIL